MVFVGAQLEGALDGDDAGDGDGVGHAGEGFGVEDVVDVAELGVGCSGEVTWEEVGEGEGMATLFVLCGLGEEGPFFHFSVFVFAIGAVLADRLFESYARC